MKKKLDNALKEKIIETTVQLMDRRGGASNVNLREVARIVGCSAPNIYNYFMSFDDLLSTALIRICEDLNNKIREKTEKAAETEDLFDLAFRSYIEYIIEKPGRLNTYHFEKLNFAISREAEASAMSVGQNIARLIYTALEQKQSFEKVMIISGIVHSYIIGAMSEYITGRVSVEDKELYITEMVEKSKRIFLSLIQSYNLIERGQI